MKKVKTVLNKNGNMKLITFNPTREVLVWYNKLGYGEGKRFINEALMLFYGLGTAKKQSKVVANLSKRNSK